MGLCGDTTPLNLTRIQKVKEKRIMIAYKKNKSQFGIKPQLDHMERLAVAKRLNINPSPSNLKRIESANAIRFNQQYVTMPFVRDGYKVYCVFSQSLGGSGYIISYQIFKKTWTCSCPDFEFQGGSQCKHILTFSATI